MPIKLGSTTMIPKGYKAVYFGTRLVYSASTEEPTLVSGVPPLTLGDALGKGIHSIIQYGKCSVSGSTITCNNGELQVVDDDLPIGYKRLESISFDGSAYYNTGKKMYGSDVVTMTISGTITTGQNLFGSYAGTSEGVKNFSLFIYGNNSSNNSYFRYGETLLRPRYGGGKKTINFGAGGTTGFYVNSTVEEETFTSDTDAWIGMLPNSTSPAFSGNIWGSITVGTRLEWIPCERVSDGTVCYYEKYSKEILTPINGTPTAGNYDTTHENTIAAVGTDEVITLSAVGETDKTASAVNLFAVGNVADTQDIITGEVIHRTEAVISDGTTPTGEYIGTVGAGNILVVALANPVTEHVTPQHLSTAEGDNTLSVTAEVSGITLDVYYYKQQ